MKYYYANMVFTIFSILLTNKYGSVEARVSLWGVATKGRNEANKHSDLSPLQFVGRGGQAISRKRIAGIENKHAAKTTSITTEIAELADCFQHANQNKNEIHVGKLLLASERLEATMRRVGLSQSANDIAGNVGKIRTVYSKLPVCSRDSMPALLQHEIRCGIDKRKIPDNSAACGFLWLGRSLNYQYNMFSYLLENEDAEPYEAASIAYERGLRPHLSWPIKKICQAAMATTLKNKRRKQMFAQIGGFREDCYGEREEKATKEDLRHMMDSLKPMLCRWRQVFSDLEIELL